MNRRTFRRVLSLSLAAMLLAPIVIAVTLGTAALLHAVGDATAAACCRWIAVAIGLLWVVMLVVTAACTAALNLTEGRGGRRRGRRPRRRSVPRPSGRPGSRPESSR